MKINKLIKKLKAYRKYSKNVEKIPNPKVRLIHENDDDASIEYKIKSISCSYTKKVLLWDKQE